MGLDIYVGPLSRYYSHDWKTIVQTWGETAGVPVTVVRPGDEQPAGIWGNVMSVFRRRRSPVDPVAAICNWRNALAARHASGTANWDWPEAPHIAYETDKPDFDGYGAVQLWAAYIDQPNKICPEIFDSTWPEDLALAHATRVPSTFSHIIGPELWLPVEFLNVFEGDEPNGNQIKIGSVFELWRQLRRLNDVSWQATDEEIRKWREHDFQPHRLESIARWGYSIWFCLAEYAAKNRLPMRLDY